IGLPATSLAEWFDVDDEVSLAALRSELLPGPKAKNPYRGGYAAPNTTAFLARLAATKGAMWRILDGAAPHPSPLPASGAKEGPLAHRGCATRQGTHACAERGGRGRGGASDRSLD